MEKLKLVLVFLTFPALGEGARFLVKALAHDGHKVAPVSILILNEVLSLSMFLIVILAFKTLFMRNVSLLREKKKGKVKDLLSNIIISFGILFGVKFVTAFVTSFILIALGKNTVVENQALLEQYAQYSMLIMGIGACIIAPICEEFIFRGAIKEVIKNKWVFITVSGLTFGLMHVLDRYTLIIGVLLIGLYLDYIINKYNGNKRVYLSLCGVLLITVLLGGVLYLQNGNLIKLIMNINLTEAIGSIVYIGMGCTLAYVYHKYDNIWVNIGAHSLNNIIGFVFILFQ